MKLVRYGAPGAERPGILDAQGRIRDLSGHVRDIDATVLDDASLDRLRAIAVDDLALVDPAERIGPCVGSVGKFVAVGLNYSDHAAETGAPIPTEPILFMKAVTSICGPNDDVVLPRGSVKSDWEVELGFVIGKRAKYVSEADALSFIAGYCVVNDVSEREYQMERGGQWMKGKCADTFGPIGPWLVTRDEVRDPQSLALFLDLNGQRKQTGTTGTMIFGVAHLVSYISRFMTLVPGDIVTTGTPPGVGLGHKPPVYLRAGDEMHLGVVGLGEQRQRVVAGPA